MNPSIALRLRTLMRAMSEVVIPAVDPGNSLAQEQAQLVLGHLNAIMQHLAHEATLNERDDGANRALAQALIAAGHGGPQTTSAVKDVSDALKDTDPAALSLALEQLVVAIGIDGEPELHAASTRLVMAHARAQNFAGRAWFKPMSFDAEPEALPDPIDLFKETEP